MKKIIRLTETDLTRIVKKVIIEQEKSDDIKEIWKSIPSDTTIVKSSTDILVKSAKNKISNKYSVIHNKLGKMEVTSANFNIGNKVLSLTLSIPFGKGVFVKNNVEDSENVKK